MECLEPEYPHIDPERFNYGFGAEDDISIDQPKGAVDSDQDLGSLNYRPLDQYSSSMTCILCLRIEEAIRVSISPISRIEVGLWRPFRVLSGTFLCDHREAITAEDLRMEKNGDKQSVRLILPVCVKSQASGTAGMLFKTLLVGLEFHYAHSRYELEGITTWDCSRLDPGIVKQFVENCREHHGSDCNELLWAAKIPRFLRVIDTKNWCVQPAPEEPFEYLALSYVWGAPTEAQSQKDIKVLRLDTTTLAELEQKGSLRKYSIPEVILDAITLCADLGYQYLWVDRLCIIQDEGSHKHSQINAMDSIYHMATLTIVSLGGCSSEGLPGVSSRPRDTKEQFKRWSLFIDGKYSYASPPSIHNQISASKWNQRGWTYQEKILSRRHLYVDENDFYLNCFYAIFESNTGWMRDHHVHPNQNWVDNLGHGYDTGVRKITGIPHPAGAAMKFYQQAIAKYTVRKLNFDQDTLNAFTGVGNLFASQHNTDMLFGLPEKYFFQSLLWHHTGTWRSRNLTADLSIPSWSWAAWEGTVSYCTQKWHYNNHTYSFTAGSHDHLGSLVSFYYVDPLRGLRRIHDDKFWFERKAFKYSDDSHELQTRCEDSIRRRVSDNFGEQYGEVSVDAEPFVEMWRNCVQNPWDAGNHAEIRDGDGSLQRKFPGKLAFNTAVATLGVRTAVVNNGHKGSGNVPDDPMYTNFNLVSEENVIVGQVFANCREMVLRTLRSGDKHRVAVAGACISNERGGSEPWGFIVIILGRNEGVYRRLALGVVNPGAWTKLTPQCETVLLG